MQISYVGEKIGFLKKIAIIFHTKQMFTLLKWKSNFRTKLIAQGKRKT